MMTSDPRNTLPLVSAEEPQLGWDINRFDDVLWALRTIGVPIAPTRRTGLECIQADQPEQSRHLVTSMENQEAGRF